MKVVNILTMILLVIGGLSWGIMGILGFNIINWLVGARIIVEHLIYILIGLAAIWQIIHCRECSKSN